MLSAVDLDDGSHRAHARLARHRRHQTLAHIIPTPIGVQDADDAATVDSNAGWRAGTAPPARVEVKAQGGRRECSAEQERAHSVVSPHSAAVLAGDVSREARGRQGCTHHPGSFGGAHTALWQ